MTTMKIFESFILFCLFSNIIQVLSQDCEEGPCTVTQSSPTSSSKNPFTTSSASISKCSDCPAGFTTSAKGSSDLNANLKLAVIIIYTIVLIAILLLVAIELLRCRRSLCFGKMKHLKNNKCQHGEIPMGERSQDAKDYGVPNNGETATYEEASESAPSVYAELNRNQEIEEDNTYQKLLKPGLDYVIPVDKKSSYEEVPNSSASVYADLNRNREDQEANDNTYQKLLKAGLYYVIPADKKSTYEEVPNSSPSVYAELHRNLDDQEANDYTYQKLLNPGLDYVIPADKKSSYEEVPNSSPSVYAELNRNQKDQEANDNTYQKLLKPGLDYVIPADKKSSYEQVPNSSPSVYAELNRNKEDQEANDNTYQKLLNPGLDYVIPADAGEEPSYEKVEKKKSPPGYTELDQTKREDVDASYQKLTKK